MRQKNRPFSDQMRPTHESTGGTNFPSGTGIPHEAGAQDVASGGLPGPTRLESHNGVKIETQTTTKLAPSSYLPVPVLAESGKCKDARSSRDADEVRESIRGGIEPNFRRGQFISRERKAGDHNRAVVGSIPTAPKTDLGITRAVITK